MTHLNHPFSVSPNLRDVNLTFTSPGIKVWSLQKTHFSNQLEKFDLLLDYSEIHKLLEPEIL